MNEKDKPIDDSCLLAKEAVPVLPCGHELSFEHELVDLMLGVVETCMAVQTSPVEPCMELIREVFAYCYLQIPTYEELLKIKLSHKMDSNSKEVN